MGETIVIGGGIEIEVIEISRTRVKLGVTAPRDVSVLRKEMLAVAAENRKALELRPDYAEVMGNLGVAPDSLGRRSGHPGETR